MVKFQQSPLTGRRMQVGLWKIAIFDQFLALSRKRYKGQAIDTVERQYELVCDLSNGVIFSDLELPIFYYWTLNISETVQDRDIITMN